MTRYDCCSPWAFVLATKKSKVDGIDGLQKRLMCLEYVSLTVFMLAKKIKQANLTRKRSTNDIHSSNQLCADKRNQLHQIFMRGPPRHCKTSTSKKRNYIMPIPSKNQKAQVISEKTGTILEIRQKHIKKT